MNEALRTSANGLLIYKHYEQGPDGGHARKPYKCPAGISTIGWGHCIVLPRDQKLASTTNMTEAEADQLLSEDLVVYEKPVKDLVKVKLTQSQFDALVSFVYNAGAGSFASSTLLKKINAGDYAGAALQFRSWNKGRVNGVLTVLNGLTARRKTEENLWNTGVVVFYN